MIEIRHFSGSLLSDIRLFCGSLLTCLTYLSTNPSLEHMQQEREGGKGEEREGGREEEKVEEREEKGEEKAGEQPDAPCRLP